MDTPDPGGKWEEGKRDVEQKEQSRRDKKELRGLSRKSVKECNYRWGENEDDEKDKRCGERL